MKRWPDKRAADQQGGHHPPDVQALSDGARLDSTWTSRPCLQQTCGIAPLSTLPAAGRMPVGGQVTEVRARSTSWQGHESRCQWYCPVRLWHGIAPDPGRLWRTLLEWWPCGLATGEPWGDNVAAEQHAWRAMPEVESSGWPRPSSNCRTPCGDFDLIDFLYSWSSAAHSPLGGGRLVLADEQGTLQNLASSRTDARRGALRDPSEDGPCSSVTERPADPNERLTPEQRVGRFTPSALEAGFTIVHALPCTFATADRSDEPLRRQTVPSSTMRYTGAGAHRCCTIASSGAQRAAPERPLDPAAAALQSRIAIEQAKVSCRGQRASMDRRSRSAGLCPEPQPSPG